MTSRKAHLISHALLLIDKGRIEPSTQVRLLGVLWDEMLAFNDHVIMITSNVSRSCYHQLWRIREICHHLSTLTVIPLVHAFILARIDYCNSILLGLPTSQLSHLQMILNDSARVIFLARWGGHITYLQSAVVLGLC